MQAAQAVSRHSWRRRTCAILVFLFAWLTGVTDTARAQQAPNQTSGGVAAPPTSTPLAFEHVTVVDVKEGRLVPDQTVVVVGNRMQRVGKAGEILVPKGAQVVNGRGQYLMPGLWDMHAHVWDAAKVDYPYFIVNGVTGVREMSQSLPIDSMLKWRREIMAGTRPGPRIVGTGGFLYGQGESEGSLIIRVATPDDARRVVDSLKAAGADFIKFRDYIPRDAYFAMADEARRLGMAYVGHAQGARIPVVEASDSGQRSLEHINDVPPCYSANELDLNGCAVIADAFVRNGTWFTPTLTIMDADVRVGARPAIALFQRKGVRLLTGTDTSPGGGVPPGISVHSELTCFVESGLTPAEALRTATINAAEYFNATDSLGTVASGKLADLVLLDADPLADIHNVDHIQAVVANGRYFDRSALNALAAATEETVQSTSACGG
jgi:imidazolonepropionase-like amidohydrolase